MKRIRRWIVAFVGYSAALAAALALPSGIAAQVTASEGGTPTFTRDVAPILQENCVECHRAGGVGPMSLETYGVAKAYAPLIRFRTGLRDRAGAMPPFYLERNVGIQEYRDVMMLSDEEIATIAAWVDAGAPEGDPADMPPPRVFAERDEGWAFEPDLVIKSGPIVMGPDEPDKFVLIPGPERDGAIPIPTAEDRYVAAVQVREINDVPSDYVSPTGTGGKWIVHHLTYTTRPPPEDGQDRTPSVIPGRQRGEQIWPLHELGRNADIFPPDEGRLLLAGSELLSNSMHLHSNGRTTTAHLEIGFKFFPKDYEAPYENQINVGFYGNGLVHDIEAGEEKNILTRTWVLDQNMKLLASEAHLHAAGWRSCLEAIWGNFEETLWCAGYDHNWVRNYWYDKDHQPLLPKGTVLRLTAELNNTPSNPNVSDPRNWSGPGPLTRSNMFHLFSVEVALTDEEFQREVAQRVKDLDLGPGEWVIGCPLCAAMVPPTTAKPADLEPPKVSQAGVVSGGD